MTENERKLQSSVVTFSIDFRSNLMGTKFTVYDHGVSPAKAQGLVEKVCFHGLLRHLWVPCIGDSNNWLLISRLLLGYTG